MTREEEQYSTLDIEQCKWWINHLFNVAKEKAFNNHFLEDAEEIQSAQDKIIKLLDQEPKTDNKRICKLVKIVATNDISKPLENKTILLLDEQTMTVYAPWATCEMVYALGLTIVDLPAKMESEDKA